MVDKVLPGGIYKSLFIFGNGIKDGELMVPTWRIIEFSYGFFQYIASANIGTREVTIAIKDSVNPILPLFIIPIAASETKKVSFGASLPATYPAVDDSIQLSSRLLMYGGIKFDISITGGFAGDMWECHGQYREWINGWQT